MRYLEHTNSQGQKVEIVCWEQRGKVNRELVFNRYVESAEEDEEVLEMGMEECTRV